MNPPLGNSSIAPAMVKGTSAPAGGSTVLDPTRPTVPHATSSVTIGAASLPAGAEPRLDLTYRMHLDRHVPADDLARPVFILVHGIGMSHRYFSRLRRHLADHGDTLTLDLPGFGNTPRPSRQLSVADYASVIAQALEANRLRDCIVVGHSMGAQFVTELALLRPDLVSAIALIGPVTDTTRPSVARNALVLALDTLLERPLTNLLVGGAYLQCGVRWYGTELPVMLGYRLDARLSRVSQPVLVLRGALDPIANRAWCGRLARVAQDGRTIDIPGQSHAAHRMRSPAVATAIADLARGSAGNPDAGPEPVAPRGDQDRPRVLARARPTTRLVRWPASARRKYTPDWFSVTVDDRQCRAYLVERTHPQSASPEGRSTVEPPVFVLVHGIGMSHRYFLRLARSLSEHGRVLVIDLPGSGWTRRPRTNATNAAHAELLATLLDDLGSSGCTVVGHSMGAQAVTELALRRADLVSRVVLIGAAVDERRRTVPQQALALGLNSILERPLLNLVQAADVLRCGPRWYLAQLGVAMTYRLEDRLPLVTQPVLVLRGSRDIVSGTRWSRSLADSSQDGALMVVAGRPHAVHHSSPALVAEHITSFTAGRTIRSAA
jgi:pimeloyl-ACP methyl ester carboxylesterase